MIKWTKKQIDTFPALFADFEDRADALFGWRKLTGEYENCEFKSGGLVTLCGVENSCGDSDYYYYTFRVDDILTKTSEEIILIHKAQEEEKKAENKRKQLILEAEDRKRREQADAKAKIMKEEKDKREYARLRRKYGDKK